MAVLIRRRAGNPYEITNLGRSDVRGGRLGVGEVDPLGPVPGAGASLDLDFAGDSAAATNLITFTRSTGGGRFNQFGLYEWVAADVPRIDHDPATLGSSTDSITLGYGIMTINTDYEYPVGESVVVSYDANNYMIGTVILSSASTVTLNVVTVVGSGTYSAWTLIVRKGLLVEEQRTNHIKYSSEFDNAAWSKSFFTVTPNTVVSPDGSTSGDTLTANTPGSPILNRMLQNTGMTTGPFVATVWLRFSPAVHASIPANNLRIFLRDGLSGSVLSTVYINLSLEWQRFTVATSSNAPDGLTFIFDDTIVSSSYSVDIWGAQVEVGTFPTSYIPTAGAAVTRAADGMQYIFGDELVKNSGTVLYCTAMQPRPGFTGVGGSPYALEAGEAYYAIASLNRQDGYYRFVGYDGVGSTSIAVLNDTSTGWLHNEQTILAHAWEHRPAENTRSTVFAINGVLRKIEGSYSPEVSKIDRIKAVPGDTQHIKSIRYIPRRLSDVELQDLTQ